MIKCYKGVIFIKNRVIISAIAVLLTILTAVFIVPISKQREVTFHNAFDTVSTIREYSMRDNTNEYLEILKDMDSKLSVYNPNSITYAINNGETVELDDEMFDFLKRAHSYSLLHGDYFDITVNPALDLWEMAEMEQKLPSGVSDLTDVIGAGHLHLNPESRTASIDKGSSISFGAIAKGYATDVIKDEMVKNNVKSGVINLGGNIFVLGKKADNTPWNIGISDPFSENGVILNIQCENEAIVTSSNANRGYNINDKFYGHIIDPKTASPSSSGLIQVTVISKSAEIADMLSTAVFVAGFEKGLELLNEYGAEAVFVTDTEIIYTNGLEGLVSDKNSDLILLSVNDVFGE